MTEVTHAFQTEAKKLLKLMINSLYSTREVFLRELISNASDAIDRLRFESLSNADLLSSDPDLCICIEFDEENGTLTVSDNGLGMSREELIENLGTIAKSGTEDFFNQLTGDQQTDANLIGQFGVGFYSAFLVADEISVVSLRAGSSQAYRWVSDGGSEFSIVEAEGERGTEILLKLKEDAKEFTDGFRLRQIIRQYSDHVAVPIKMAALSEEKEIEVVNRAKALWTRPRTDVSDDEYKEFYKHIAHDFTEPLAWAHNRVEGRLDYTSLLYIPAKSSFRFFNEDDKSGLKLYAQRVFIMDDVEAFLPPYMSWVKGVVDISDFPLNMSRETIQENESVGSIRSALTKRVVDLLLKHVDDDAESYNAFWKEFGNVIKTRYDWDNSTRDFVPKLFRFASTHNDSDDQITSMTDYVNRMQTDQDEIYYIVGESVASLRNHPLVEVFKERNIEVLLLADDFDSHTISFFTEFDGKKLRDVTIDRESLPTLDTESTVVDGDSEFLNRVKEALADAVTEVAFSERLTTSASCLIRNRPWMSRGMRAVMDAAQQVVDGGEAKLELNRKHALVKYVEVVSDEARFADIARLLLDHALLANGSLDVDSTAYLGRINSLLSELLHP